jgi:hypothetical protein
MSAKTHLRLLSFPPVTVFIFSIFLLACSTPYQPMGPMGGYEEAEMGEGYFPSGIQG